MSKEVTVTIAGGGSTYTPGIVQAILENPNQLRIKELRLYDIDQVRQERMGYLIQALIKKNYPFSVRFLATDNPEEAFTGADFVFSQIRAGGLQMRETDEKIPLKYGCVGQETCGAGGFAYGLRSIKAFLPLVEKIIHYAPDAWILNYSNPESIVSEAVARKFPKAKIINVCDMTISIEETICSNFGYEHADFIPEYYGLNHFGWYRSIYSKKEGRDILPDILHKMNNGLDVADFNTGDASWARTYRMLGQMITDFPGYLPNTYMEYYLYPDVVVAEADPNHTRANEVMEGRETKVYALAEKCMTGENNSDIELNFGSHGQYIVDIATSLLNDEHRRFMIITPNRGSIPNIRPDAVVEVPAYVCAKGVEPIALDAIPDFHKGLIEAQCAAEKLLVDAFFEESYLKALQAFTLNQAVPSATVAKKMLHEFIEVNKDFWPELR
ncbi:maltose-6'-phosphate glucosidase [Listeria ivanovii]|uniref:Putative 6-phospho-glucosidase n=1 Tax=Listeria ivanovii (strain ATCC BAA-678 / PAM 55) TaxID=881621 RepID=G2Z8V5_LISIP|nr:maltose-6'-phosphate glucosidase [Listeria ivanovii]MBC1759554.1 6-phospho-alpha-glucosidase [Listeria ivanovii]MCJ1718718.1 6-phospho-alpha-glucosidase [Listeria ivanovii]MCJ1736588.1 6-phospho-alpha-glucosidase [Listeria ivanovii]PZF87874.1 maltose-6'-phosphate glucosidase [Listeria ivanovii]PZF93044.1 maltose-6'-phosphate glucosidase [Listeria ivanovii]